MSEDFLQTVCCSSCGSVLSNLLVKKSDAETIFYYMGLFDIVDAKADKKRDNKGRERDIAKVKVKMRHAEREDLLRYLQSSIKEKTEEKAG